MDPDFTALDFNLFVLLGVFFFFFNFVTYAHAFKVKATNPACWGLHIYA